MSLFSFIKEKLSILDVISQSVIIKQAGSYWKGPCPFHIEKDASFTVSPERQIFYCFGCHASGDVIGFIARLENMPQKEAATYLIERYQLTVPSHIQVNFSQSTEEYDTKNRYFQLCKLITQWTHNNLLQNINALKYIQERCISEEFIKTFQIGYFPSGVVPINNLIQTLTSNGFLLHDLQTYSIVIEGKSVLFSPFEERIIFPIKDNLGRYCGFGGRVFKQGDERPKYYNSKECEGFEKGKLLFGYDLAKKSLLSTEKAFLVEGYIDCIIMAQHGYHNTIATLGTSCTLHHLKTLARSIQTLYVLYDGDAAGIKAILRLAELCWESNLDLKIVSLPPEHDPASLLSQHGSIQALIESAPDIITFYITTMGSQFSAKSLAQKMITAEKIARVISKLTNHFKQDLLLHHAASIMQLPFESLKELLIECKQKKQIPTQDSLQKDELNYFIVENSQKTDIIILEEKIFSAILESINTNALIQVPESMRMFFSPLMQKILIKFDLFTQKNNQESVDIFLNSLDVVDKKWAEEVQMMHNGIVYLPMIEMLYTHFFRFHWKNIVDELKNKLTQAKKDKNQALVLALLEQFAHMKETIVTRGLMR